MTDRSAVWRSRRTVALAFATVSGAVVGFVAGRFTEDLDALELLTAVLVVVTIYYALQTRAMVVAMRDQQAEMSTQADRVRAQPAIEDWIERSSDFSRDAERPQALRFARNIRDRRALVSDHELLDRLEVAQLALQTYGGDGSARDTGSSAMVVKILVGGLQDSLMAAVRGWPLPPLPSRWLERTAVQAAVIDAPATLERWK
jgi:hypothetical protein